MPGPGLVAEVVVRKFKDHMPLERQSQIFTRRYGVPLAPSTLDDWVGGAARVLEPIALLLLKQVLSDSHISLDDTPIRVLDPQHPAGVKRGHIWSLVGRQEVAYRYESSWSGKPIRELLAEFDGVLQGDGDRPEKDAHEEGNDGYHHQQLDQRETVAAHTEETRRVGNGCGKSLHLRHIDSMRFKAKMSK